MRSSANDDRLRASIQDALERISNVDLEIAHLVIELPSGSSVTPEDAARIAEAVSTSLRPLLETSHD